MVKWLVGLMRFPKGDPEKPWQKDVQLRMIWSIPILGNLHMMSLDTMNE